MSETMYVRAPKTRPERTVALALSASIALTEHGDRVPIAGAGRELVVYSHRTRELMLEVMAGTGRARWWRRRMVAFDFGHKVHGTRDLLADLDPTDALAALVCWADWIRSAGGNPASFASSSWGVWRANLGRTRRIVTRKRFGVPEHALSLGSRQHSRPGRYTDATVWDLTAAYPSTLGALHAPTTYRHVTRVGRHERGFVRAEVSVPGHLLYGPLPQRGRYRTEYPPHALLDGIWDATELDLARSLGCVVTSREGWIARGTSAAWRGWYDRMIEGRELPARARRLAKITANALWGAFATHGVGAWVHYEDGRAVMTPDDREARPPALPIAAHVAAAVRTRIYRDALWLGEPVVRAHTDGVILLDGYKPDDYPLDGAPGRWRLVDRAQILDVRTAQAFRYTRETGELVYVLAGVPTERAPATWDAISEARARRLARAG